MFICRQDIGKRGTNKMDTDSDPNPTDEKKEMPGNISFPIAEQDMPALEHLTETVMEMFRTSDLGSAGETPTYMDTVKEDEQMNKGLNCFVCKKLLEKPAYCSKCGKVVYCGKECQSKDWQFHMPMCKPFEFGRIEDDEFPYLNIDGDKREEFFVAKKKIPPYTKILSDKPVFFITYNDLSTLSPNVQNCFMGEYSNKFQYISGDNMKFKNLPALSMLEFASRKVAWLIYEHGLRLKWEGGTNELIPNFRKTVIPQEGYNKLANNGLLSQRELFMINRILPCSLTTVYSRSCSNALGEGLFMNSWRLTYSCAPNCIAYMSKGELKVVSVMDIEAGEQITIAYHPSIICKSYYNRRSFLHAKYGIAECACRRCIGEGADDLSTGKTDEKLEVIVQECLETINKVNDKHRSEISKGLTKDYEGHDVQRLIDALDKIIVYKDEIREYETLVQSLNLHFSAFIIDYHLEVDAARVPYSQLVKYIPALKQKLLLLIGDRMEVSQVYKRVFASYYLDKVTQDFMYSMKNDFFSIYTIIKERERKGEAKKVPDQDFEILGEADKRLEGHYEVLPDMKKMAQIISGIFEKSSLYFELILLGIDLHETDMCMEYYQTAQPPGFKVTQKN